MPWDAEFYAFLKLSNLATALMPNVKQYSKEQVDALHTYAQIMARDLTSGNYAFNKERHKAGG